MTAPTPPRPAWWVPSSLVIVANRTSFSPAGPMQAVLVNFPSNSAAVSLVSSPPEIGRVLEFDAVVGHVEVDRLLGLAFDGDTEILRQRKPEHRREMAAGVGVDVAARQR